MKCQKIGRNISNGGENNFSCHGCFPTRGRPHRSQEVFSSTESDEGEEEEDDSGEDNEGDHEGEDEDEDDEVFVQPPPPRSKQPRGARPPRRNGEISPPLSASPAAPTSVFGKNSAANHGVKMVEGVGGDVADVLEVRALLFLSAFNQIRQREVLYIAVAVVLIFQNSKSAKMNRMKTLLKLLLKVKRMR